MVTVLQIFFVLALIVLIILLVFRTRRSSDIEPLPENLEGLLSDYVHFYQQLNGGSRLRFEQRVGEFLSAVRITGVNAEIEDLDRVLIGAGAVIPVFAFSDWQYVNLHEVLVYPGNFNQDFDQSGIDRSASGMVGTGALQHMMILGKWQLRQGFLNRSDANNTAIHEFAHLIDKMDGSMDGVPAIILEKKYVAQWVELMNGTMDEIRRGLSNINPYGATSPVEFFAVISEYFFEQPDALKHAHPSIFAMLERIYRTHAR
jgi:MtfA peptidase